MTWKFWQHPISPLDRKAITPRLAEVLHMARKLTNEIAKMNDEADAVLKHWSERLAHALDELDATLKRGESQPDKDKY